MGRGYFDQTVEYSVAISGGCFTCHWNTGDTTQVVVRQNVLLLLGSLQSSMHIRFRFKPQTFPPSRNNRSRPTHVTPVLFVQGSFVIGGHSPRHASTQSIQSNVNAPADTTSPKLDRSRKTDNNPPNETQHPTPTHHRSPSPTDYYYTKTNTYPPSIHVAIS
jgi:hypothetical protein